MLLIASVAEIGRGEGEADQRQPLQHDEQPQRLADRQRDRGSGATVIAAKAMSPAWPTRRRPKRPTTRRIGPGRQRHRRGDRGEDQPDQLPALEHVEDDLLDRGDVGGQPAEDRGQRQRVAERQAVGRSVSRAARRSRRVERAAIFGVQRLGQPARSSTATSPRHSRRAARKIARHGADQQDRLAEARREHRHQHEDHEHQAHHLAPSPRPRTGRGPSPRPARGSPPPTRPSRRGRRSAGRSSPATPHSKAKPA